jgi:hypothetical protein
MNDTSATPVTSASPTATAPFPTGLRLHTGGCHCGAVRFQVEVDLAAGATRCNCSMCTKVAQTSNTVKPGAFQLLSDPAKLGVYEWGGRVLRRYFCKTCGIHCFTRGHLAELGGDFVGVSFNCLDDVDPAQLKIGHWDGRHDNWHAGPRDTPWPIFG